MSTRDLWGRRMALVAAVVVAVAFVALTGVGTIGYAYLFHHQPW